MHVPLSQLLTVGRSPDHPVAASGDGTIPFSRLRRDVAHNAARLRERACRCGAPVCRDSYWFLVGLLALYYSGAEVVIPPNRQPGTLEAFRVHCDLFLLDGPADECSAMILEPGLPGAEMSASYDPAMRPVHFFTSGSTGAPKRITRSAALLENEVRMLVGVWEDWLPSALVSATVSHQHVYGMIFRLLWPVETGRPFSATTHAVWETVLEELQPGGMLVTSPAHLTRMAGIGPIVKHRAPAIVLSAGAPLPADAARDAAYIFGVAPTEIFGSTETGACAVRQTVPADQPWQPLPGVRFDVTKDAQLKINSPAVAPRQWHETADLADLLADGTFRFRGRSDRIVKIEGKRVSLSELEQRLEQLPWVKSAAATIAGTGAGRLAAVVVLEPSGQAEREKLGDFRFGQRLRRELSGTQEPAGLPRLWRFVDALPEGAMGKRRSADLAALFTNGEET